MHDSESSTGRSEDKKEKENERSYSGNKMTQG